MFGIHHMVNFYPPWTSWLTSWLSEPYLWDKILQIIRGLEKESVEQSSTEKSQIHNVSFLSSIVYKGAKELQNSILFVENAQVSESYGSLVMEITVGFR